jgi:hypothetical protein
VADENFKIFEEIKDLRCPNYPDCDGKLQTKLTY